MKTTSIYIEGREGEEAEASCTYGGRALDDSAGGAGENRMRVPVPCPHEGIGARPLHVGASGADRARVCRPQVHCHVPLRVGGGKLDPPSGGGYWRSTNDRAWGGGAALRTTIQFANLLQRKAPGPGPASLLTTGGHSPFELLVRAHGRILTISLVLCSLSCLALGLLQGVYLGFPRLRE